MPRARALQQFRFFALVSLPPPLVSLPHSFHSSARHLHGPGMWGAYPDAVLPGLGVVEGGQTSTGSAVAWFRRLVSGGKRREGKEKEWEGREGKGKEVRRQGGFIVAFFRGVRPLFIAVMRLVPLACEDLFRLMSTTWTKHDLLQCTCCLLFVSLVSICFPPCPSRCRYHAMSCQVINVPPLSISPDAMSCML